MVLPAPLFSFYGSKIRLGGRYPSPKFSTIVEPFAGAAGYSRHHTAHNVILYERDPVVYAVLDYLIGASSEDILSLPLNVEEIEQLSDAQRWSIGFWLNRACAYPRRSFTSWSLDRDRHKDSRIWGERCRRRLAQTVQEIKHWEVFLLSWSEIDVASHAPCTWFVDPPYQISGSHYRFGSEQIDYEKLGRWCQSLPGQVIVCENSGADWLPFRPFHKGCSDALHANRKGKAEVIWTNSS